MAKNNLEVRLTAKDLTAAGLKSATKGVTKFAGLASAALGGIGIAKLADDFIETTVTFQRLNASLITVTGSSKAADAAFANLRDFATKTPFQLETVVDAFAKMKALGLDPSNAALMSYGNTAAGLGKDLNQMVEAVADAATGEFERLKEFGIKAKSEGDRVSFTFAGVTTTVGKNAAEIERYLQGLGNNQFAGGMARQMDTLGGALSNLKDAYANMLADIGNGEAGDNMIDAVNALAETLKSPAFTQAMANLITGASTLANIAAQQGAGFVEDVGTTGEWWGAFSMGDISFWEFMFSGTNKEYMRERLQEVQDARDGLTRGKIGPQTPGFAEYQKGAAAPAAGGGAQGADAGEDAAAAAAWQRKLLEAEIAEQERAEKEKADSQLALNELRRQAERDKELEHQRGMAADRLTAMQDAFLSEEDLLLTQYERKRQIVQEAMAIGAGDEAGNKALLLDLETQYLAEKQALDEKTWQQKVQVASLTMSTLTNLTDAFYTLGGKKSRKMFEVNKAASIAETSIHTYMSATKAYQSLAGIPIVGPALGAAAAAAAVAAGLANIAKIKSQKFDGGGGGGASSYSSNAGGFLNSNPVVQQPDQKTEQQQSQGMTIVVQGNIIGEDDWIEQNLVPALNRATSRNVTVDFRR